jgi:hypothetical protein
LHPAGFIWWSCKKVTFSPNPVVEPEAAVGKREAFSGKDYFLSFNGHTLEITAF